MVATNDAHVVIGGAGGTGAALVAELLGRGHRVRSVSRRGTPGPVGTEAVAADVGIPSQVLDATRGAAVIYQAAQPAYHRWTIDFPPMQAALLAAAKAHSSKLVMADNLYMYGPIEGLMREDTPPHPVGKKGHLRAQLAEELLAAHRAGRVRVAIGRSSDYFGPGGVNSTLGEFLFDAAVKNKTTRWLGSLDVPHAVSYLEDMAVGLATLGRAGRGRWPDLALAGQRHPDWTRVPDSGLAGGGSARQDRPRRPDDGQDRWTLVAPHA